MNNSLVQKKNRIDRKIQHPPKNKQCIIQKKPPLLAAPNNQQKSSTALQPEPTENAQHLNQKPTERKYQNFHQPPDKKQAPPSLSNQPSKERDHAKIAKNKTNHPNVTRNERGHVKITRNERDHLKVVRNERAHTKVARKERDNLKGRNEKDSAKGTRN